MEVFYLVGFCYCDKTFWPKETWKGKALFSLHVHSITEGSQGRTQSGPWRQDVNQRLRRSAAYWLAFLVNLGSPAQGWHCPEWWGSSTSVLNQDNVPQASLMEAVSPLKFPFAR